MDIKSLINENLIKLNLESTKRDDAFKELINLLEQENLIYDKEKFFEAVSEREKLGTTAIGMGLAIPHGKTNIVKKPSLCFGMSKAGVDYISSYDDKPVNMIFLIAVPDDSDDLHLKILANLSRKLMHKEFREKIMNSKTNTELLESLSEIS